MYPKVFDDFYRFRKHFGFVEKLPTPSFYYPMKPNEEILVNIEDGKNLLIRFRHMGEANEDGMREIFFQINGQTRNIFVKDNSIQSSKAANVKTSSPNDVGAPLQGKLVSVLVNEGDFIEKGKPLFVIEAMKMESTINAHMSGTVSKVYLKQNSMVEQDDCVVTIKE
jgi:pyruvate carboxylase